LAGAAPRGTHADNVGNDDGINRPDYYRYVEQAFPKPYIAPAQTGAARAAFAAISNRAGLSADWTQLSYAIGRVPAPVTYTNRQFTASGRVTALTLTPGCDDASQGACQAFLGAAGGGVWVADTPFDRTAWSPALSGLQSNAIGAIAFDPNGRGLVVYAGTGEQNSSADSEAGVGLFNPPMAAKAGRSFRHRLNCPRACRFPPWSSTRAIPATSCSRP
jgi:hypothetical protein